MAGSVLDAIIRLNPFKTPETRVWPSSSASFPSPRGCGASQPADHDRPQGTFFALLMSVYNAGAQGAQITGGYLYDWLGYEPLVLISAGFTALAWLLVPLVRIDRIEAKARSEADGD